MKKVIQPLGTHSKVANKSLDRIKKSNKNITVNQTSNKESSKAHLIFDSQSGDISVEGKVIGRWNDDARFDYPEDLTWQRTLGDLCQKMFDAGRNIESDQSSCTQSPVREVLKKFTTLRYEARKNARDVAFKINFKGKLNLGLSNLDNLSLFKTIISESLKVFDLSYLELAEMLKTTRPTILRWKSGETSPHILIRESVYKSLLKRLSFIDSKK
jgi:ribosome-binding protein aMBF1 (putative translation factor)